MKRLLFILTLICCCAGPLFAQEADDDNGNEKIRDRMSEYIQKRLNLSSDESKKFAPVFVQYFKEWRKTMKENKGDALLRRQRVVDLQLRYRTQFRDLLGEQRGNQVFGHQDDFIRELRELNNLRKERLRTNPDKPLRRSGALILH